MARTLPKDWETRFDAETLALAKRIVRRTTQSLSSFDVHDVAMMLKRANEKKLQATP